jgi:hypothetical protein
MDLRNKPEMSTRLTNNYLDFVSHVQTELANPFSADSEIIFAVFPSLGSGHFSIQLIETDEPFLFVRQWRQDLGEGGRLGIYNLDSIKIDEHRVVVSTDDFYAIRNIKTLNIQITDLNEIILDGVDFELIVRKQIFRWRKASQISVELKGLLEKMVDMAGL